jgi:hypothetical protein
MMYQDPEILAMSQVLEAFNGLDNVQRKRILDWITSKFGITPNQVKVIAQEEIQIAPVVKEEPQPQSETKAEEPEEEDTPEEKAETVNEEEPTEEAETPEEETADEEEISDIEPEDDSTTDPLKGLGLKRYKSIETLFLSSNIKTVASKILLAAAYLQEKMGYDEISSFDINSRLKKMGYGVSNISNSLNTLLKKEPPLMIQTRKDGDSKQAKRKFQVTEEGLKVARTYLRGKK